MRREEQHVESRSKCTTKLALTITREKGAGEEEPRRKWKKDKMEEKKIMPWILNVNTAISDCDIADMHTDVVRTHYFGHHFHFKLILVCFFF